MKVSLNTIRRFIDFELPPVDELVARINAQLGGVEKVIDLAAVYKDVVVVKVVSAEKHPNADRLSVCLIDDGGVVKDVERNTDGFVQVVCGAPNAHTGMFAAWLPPKSTIPASHGDPEPFVLDARELRSVKSSGMLAAADELALGSDHTGIIEISPEEQRPYEAEIKPGASFAAAFGLNDTILEIENKMFTHRPDLFGQLGIAREIAGILGKQFTDPDWYWGRQEPVHGQGLELKVFNEAEEQVSRFMAVALKDIEVKPSPLWLQIELVRLGGKPINNIVDATNYVMLLTAQPTHAYDYDKLRGAALGVRMAKPGEACSLLNGKSYELTEDDIVIVDGEGIVGLGGVMGGGNSEVSETTTRIVLETATFDMYAIRKTSMRHGLFTDAVTRFNKGQSPLQNDRVLQLLINSIRDTAGGELASDITDLHALGSAYEQRSMSGTLKVEADFINTRLGLQLPEKDIEQLLRNVHFACYVDEGDTAISITAPFWRTDIELPEDIVEEVGRLYGFDTLPRELPQRSIAPAPHNLSFETKRRVRARLAAAGANEVLTYSFVHERTLKKAGQDPARAYRLSNALSPDLQYYRLSVLPSLLDKVHMDVKSGFDEFVLFEIGKAHSKSLELDGEGLPHERSLIDLVLARKWPLEGAPYYQARYLVEFLLKGLDIEAVYKPVDEPRDDNAWAPFELSRSAVIESRNGTYLGIVGELRSEVRAHFKLPDYTAAASLSLDALESLVASAGSHYRTLSRYPSITRDVSLRVSSDITYHEMYHVLWHAVATRGTELDITIEPVSVYQADNDTAHKTITFHMELTSPVRTLQDVDANPLVDALAAAARDTLGAELV